TTIVLVSGVHFLHAYQIRRNAGVLREQAESALALKDYQRAVTYFRQYLGFVPTDIDAFADYALLLTHDKIATTQRARLHAFLSLESVLRSDANRTEVRRKTA